MIPPGFLTARLDLFDFASMVNKQSDGSDAYVYESLRAGGRDIICMVVLNNLYMICCHLRAMEQFMVDLAWNRQLADKPIGEEGEFCLEYSRRQLAGFGAMADCYYGWDDVAGQNEIMFAPGLFRQYLQPLYRRLFDDAKRYDLPVSWRWGSAHGSGRR